VIRFLRSVLNVLRNWDFRMHQPGFQFFKLAFGLGNQRRVSLFILRPQRLRIPRLPENGFGLFARQVQPVEQIQQSDVFLDFE